ncbi:MAG: hypothetical protein MI794_07735 [Pseudomonadales bacterium]|nr:hypothetical protein [Pseudomonadales bacterium]
MERPGMLFAVVWISLFSMAWAGLARAADMMVLSTFSGSGLNLVQEPIIREAYRRLGIELKILQLPAERALQMASRGQVDGEVARLAVIREQYPSLVMVPEPLFMIENVVFSKDISFPVQGYQSLQPYQVVTLRGYKHFEERLTALQVDFSLLPTYEQIFQTIDKDRFQLALLTRLDGLKTLSELDVSGVFALEPPLEVVPAYHFLHRKHAHLVPRLTRVLREMRQAGVIEQIQLRVQQELVSRAVNSLAY